MADTLIVKILRNRSGGTPLQAGDIAVCDVDLAAIIDIQFSHDRFGGLVAEQFNSLFYRNCINYGLLALTVPDARELITEGDRVSLDTEAGRLVNQTTGTTAQAVPLPGFLREIVAAGGIFPQLEASGRLRPATEL